MLKNTAWSVLNSVVSPLLMLVATPVLVANLGLQNYAAYVTFAALAGLGGLAGLGSGAALLREIAGSSGAMPALRQQVMRASLSTLLLGFASVLTPAALFSGSLGLMLFPQLASLQAQAFFLAALLFVMLEQLDGLQSSAMRGLQNYSLLMIFDALHRVVMVAGLIVAALVWKNSSTLVVVALVAMLARLVAKSAYCGKMFGWRCLWPSTDLRSVRRIFRDGKWAWLQAMTGTLYGSSDKLLVGVLLGPVELACYAVFNQVAQQVHLLLSAALNPVFPAMARRQADGNAAGIASLWRKSLLLNLSLVLGLGLPLVLAAKPLIALWIADPVIRSRSADFQMLVISYGVIAANVAAYYALMGLGHYRVVAANAMAAAVVSILLLAVLTPLWGLDGVIASKLAYGLVTFHLFIVLRRALQSATTPISAA